VSDDTDGVVVCRLTDIPDRGMRTFTVEGESVLLARIGETVYALLDECSHDGAPLSEGELDEEAVVCPWHFSRFCLRTGAVLESPAHDDIPTYAVTMSGGEVSVHRIVSTSS